MSYKTGNTFSTSKIHTESQHFYLADCMLIITDLQSIDKNFFVKPALFQLAVFSSTCIAAFYGSLLPQAVDMHYCFCAHSVHVCPCECADNTMNCCSVPPPVVKK